VGSKIDDGSDKKRHFCTLSAYIAEKVVDGGSINFKKWVMILLILKDKN